MSDDGRAYGRWGEARQPDLPCLSPNISANAMSKKDADREARLAAALRDNLKRRKAQARAGSDQNSDDTQPASE